MMMNGVMILEDNMSQLTSGVSNEAVSISSTSRNELVAGASTLYSQQPPFAISPNQLPPPKKKRNLPGNPDPDAEVVALSPKTLITTNRFLCEICNKGFQRDQNLQLHRRGHNLPWKLKQRSNKEVVKRKVYICPEPTCVHHDPSRALGDLTGVKKHFFRKHGEKKWKCEKCSKRYAVQSDWKTHSKICGTREYRCDCGTLFSRRDSFITHRAFCDALAQETTTARGTTNLAISTPNPILSSHNNFNLHNNNFFQLKTEPEYQNSFNLITSSPHLLPPWLTNPNPVDLSTHLFSPPRVDSVHHHHHHSTFNHMHNHQNPNPSSTSTRTPPSLVPSFQPPLLPPHMSATALLQKAAQMGVKISNPSDPSSDHDSILISRPHQAAHMMMSTTTTPTAPSTAWTRGFCSAVAGASLASSAAGSCLGFVPSTREERGGGLGERGFVLSTSGCMEQVGATTTATSMMKTSCSSSSLTCGGSGFHGSSSSFEEALMNGMLNHKMGGGSSGNGSGGNDGLTRDFLGLRAPSFPNMSGFDHMSSSSSSYEKLTQNQTPWQG
ncbi:protein indeterminate-domain 7-like [Rhododendron vialii]|uniref:protein indeterminate-domain 7-like n=1 Tax=Rhododendron vialii TaxID=182163 RepID=UPI00265F87F8|nr:protein indeterminate-domain 7-like [Rhododendron vialii]